jgi:hypothetical protein
MATSGYHASHEQHSQQAPRVLRRSPQYRDSGRLQQYVDAGATDIYLFNVAPPQREVIEVFGERVLPVMRGAR